METTLIRLSDEFDESALWGLMSGARVSCWLASSIHVLWLSIVVYVLAAFAAIVGFGLTFRG